MLGNIDKSACAGVVQRAVRLVRGAGRVVCTERVTAGLAALRAEVFDSPAELARHVDLLLIFGGDGTMLRVARQIAGSRTPILGVNIGSLGFLTAVPSSEMRRALEHVWNGEFTFEARALLQVCGHVKQIAIAASAFNDIVISRGTVPRLIELEVCVDGDLLARYRCDGLIVSSPTGSTAYSLAAGGAVVFPTADVLALTPICPHTLSNRALILPGSAKINVKVITPKTSTILSADGQVVVELPAGDSVVIARSRQTVRLLHLSGSSFCQTLRRKLHWRGATL